MQMNAFQTFLAIIDGGSFHAAAQQLNVTQTAVSARIKALEQSLGASLFERGPGGTRLSAAGRQFRPYAEQMLRTWEFVSSDLSGQMGRRVALRMGSQLSVWDPLLVDVAVWMEQEQGKVPFTLNYDHTLNMGEAVRQQLFDIAVVNEAPVGTRLGVEELPPERLVLVSDQPVTLEQDELPLFINMHFGPEYEIQLQGVIPRQNRQHIVLGNAQMGLRYLLKRGGMGYFPLTMVQEALAQRVLQVVAKTPEMQLACKALYLPDNPALALIEEVIQGFRALRSA